MKDKVCEGDWVFVQIATKRSVKYYAGNIIAKLGDDEDGDFTSSFLQKKLNNQFIWPKKKDQSIIDINQIKMFLPRPNDLVLGTSTRSSFVFHTDFKELKDKIF